MIRNITALTQRELSSIFLSLIAYIVGLLFLIATAMLFMFNTFTEGGEASLQPLFGHMAWLLILAIPLVTMRMISEEYASGTIETLMTAPVSDTEVVLGKFFGAMSFFFALVLATCVYAAILSMYGKPDVTVMLYGYLGLLLLGAFYAAVGLFASSLTRHQLIAAVLGMAILGILTYAMDYVASLQSGSWRLVFSYVNVLNHFEDFSRGIVDTKAVVFFVSATLFFLFLSVKVMESKRWR
ncbi:MAG: ABC transporter permease subunit [Phycisphaerales bacterium]|nr:ABC transporter permease subunit [Phycisphaerales bacterium]MCB9862452.1 ABC transporter permease subunit [Phycisphaerales bacterium]